MASTHTQVVAPLRYLVATEWLHDFRQFGERAVQFVYDTEQDAIVSMQVLAGWGGLAGYLPASPQQIAEVEVTLKHVHKKALVQPEVPGLSAAGNAPILLPG